MKTIRQLLVSSAAVALAACGATTPPPAGDLHRQLVSHVRSDSETSVLFIGNSYSFGVPRAFAKLAAANGRRVHVEQATHNGWSLTRHAEDAETLRKLRGRRWDVVVLQEQSLLPSYPLRRNFTMLPAVRKLASEIRAQGAIPVLYQTWGRRNGDPQSSRDDFHAMTARVRDGYRIASEKSGGLLVVPVGDAWEREVSAGHADQLFRPDGSHPTPAADALSARVFYETIFGQ